MNTLYATIGQPLKEEIIDTKGNKVLGNPNQELNTTNNEGRGVNYGKEPGEWTDKNIVVNPNDGFERPKRKKRKKAAFPNFMHFDQLYNK